MAKDTSQGLFEFTVDPKLGSVRFALAEWSNSLKDLSPAFRDIYTLFKLHEKHHLESEGKDTGAPFPPLSKGAGSYGEWKRDKFPRARILERGGVLYRALVEGGEGSIQGEIGKRQMRVGIDPGAQTTASGPFWWWSARALKERPYALGRAALAHSTGFKTKQGVRVPPRPPVRFDGDVTSRGSFGYAVQQILQAHIVRERKKSPALQKALKAKFGGVPKSFASERTIKDILSQKWK